MRRPDVYFGSDRPGELRLVLTPPPALLQAGGGDTKLLAKELLRKAAKGEAQESREHTRPALGPDALRAMHPWSEPKTLVESGGRRVPRWKVGGRGPEAQALRIRAAKEWKSWKGGYWGSLEEWPENREVPFPHGTYEMRRFHRANVADPVPGAVLSAPGNPGAIEAVSRDALREAAQAGIDESLHVLRSAQEYEAANAARGEPEERHRFTKRKPRTDAPRLIVKRDRRRGRPSPWADAPRDPEDPLDPGC
ncbi:MAG: hypothetical protein AAF447_24695 [Myxococcota bacterium]